MFLRTCLLEYGVKVLAINTGVLGTTDRFEVDFESEEVATAAGTNIATLRSGGNRGEAIEKMGIGAAQILHSLVSQEKVNGVIGMGGGGGTYIALAAMQSVPFGTPKICISTVATKDLSRQTGCKDITLMPSIVDIAGLNSISRVLISQAAGAICGMVSSPKANQFKLTSSIALSMFGNTTGCVEKCSELLKAKNHEVLTFHAVGVGGRTMESLILEGCFDAALDITTTELADELCQGICSAGPDRLTAAAKVGLPQVVAPGCLDMVNYGHMDTVPKQYRNRQLYSWAPDVTLMRTNKEENKILGSSLSKKLNKSTGKVSILLPLRGVSQIGNPGGVFHNPEIDQVLFDAIKDNIKKSIDIIEIDANINDAVFAERSVAVLLEMMGK
jgi:uncharacterized protein (UPF0261 family)